MTIYLCILSLMTVAFSTLRFSLPINPAGLQKKDIFKDLAHIFVGSLFGAAILASLSPCPMLSDIKSILWSLAIGLTVVEIVAFFIRKK